MTKYSVLLPEIWYQTVLVEAESEEDAISKVLDGEGEMIDSPEYSHTIDNGSELMVEEYNYD